MKSIRHGLRAKSSKLRTYQNNVRVLSLSSYSSSTTTRPSSSTKESTPSTTPRTDSKLVIKEETAAEAKNVSPINTKTTATTGTSHSSSDSTVIEKSISINDTKTNINKFIDIDKWSSIWNDLSGVHEISTLKEKVTKAAHDFDVATATVTTARRHVNDITVSYERTTNQHTTLLQRKENWTSQDATNFADLVSKEVSIRNELETARVTLQQAEKELSNCQLEYMNAMRQRYHEEQIWQDKWRMLGTFGTWSLIVLNSFVFLVSQYIREMKERQRLLAMKGFIQETITANSSSTIITTNDDNTYNTTQSGHRTNDSTEHKTTKDLTKGKNILNSSVEGNGKNKTTKESSKENNIPVLKSSVEGKGGVIMTKDSKKEKNVRKSSGEEKGKNAKSPKKTTVVKKDRSTSASSVKSSKGAHPLTTTTNTAAAAATTANTSSSKTQQLQSLPVDETKQKKKKSLFTSLWPHHVFVASTRKIKQKTAQLLQDEFHIPSALAGAVGASTVLFLTTFLVGSSSSSRR